MDLDDELRRLFADDRLDVPVRQEAHRAVVTRAKRLRRRRRSRVVLGGGMLSVATMLLAGTAFGVGGDAPARQPMAAPETPALTSFTTEPPPTTTTVVPTSSVAPPVMATSTPVSTTTTTATTTSTSTTKPRPPAARLAFGPTAVGGLRLGMARDDAVASGLIQPNLTPVDAAGCQGYDWSGHANPPSHYSLLFSPKYGLVQIGGRADAETPEGVYDGASEADVRALYPDQAKPHVGGLEWVTPVPGNPNAHYWFVFADHMVADVRLELAVQDCYQ
ncbi:hypothetical protein [Kutzneria buriramensis]|uniref:Uncharacterized protein n=1 Tax=Kutzneria buriramensis TaxID=1045776 RepID=A0A3E0HU98_9PSEU|nr:hypothetical protein [Kutzneria buriramensis]REH49981.1 hypothetical protein BCF44_104248 [Kutzneria buriramensis]